MPEVAPVDLHLFARQRAQAQVGLGRRARAHRAHQVAKVAALPSVATLANHVVQPAGRERGVLLQCLSDEVPVRFDQTDSQRDARWRSTVLAQHTAHRVAVYVQLARDGPYAPVLDRVQTLDSCGQIKRDGHAHCARERRCRAASAGAHGQAAHERIAGTPVPRAAPPCLWPPWLVQPIPYQLRL